MGKQYIDIKIGVICALCVVFIFTVIWTSFRQPMAFLGRPDKSALQ